MKPGLGQKSEVSKPAADASVPAPEPQQLMESCQGLVRALAIQIARRLPPRIELDDLIGYGQLGLAQAARDFDVARGRQFTTFAYYRIRGAIFDGLREVVWFNKPEYHGGRYDRLGDDILEVDDEAGEGGSKSANEFAWLSQISSSLAVVHLTGNMAALTGGDLSDPRAEPPDETVSRREVCERLRCLIDALPGDAGSLIRLAYFENCTLQEAGRRLGISKAWASRLHARTIQRLARALRLMTA